MIEAEVSQLSFDLREIEAILGNLPEVKEAAVVIRDRVAGGPQLVAYVVPEGPFDAQRLHAYLESRSPRELRPVALVPVPYLSFTETGQVDKEALNRLVVIDTGLIAEWEMQLQALPEIERVALVAEDDTEPVPTLHLSDLLPGWKPASTRDVDDEWALSARVPESRKHAGAGTPAISHGGPVWQDAGAPTTLPAVLERAARESPQTGVVCVQPDGAELFHSYPALLAEAERILSGLKQLGLKPQDKVLFQLDRSQDFIAAFWACQLGGLVPVPISIAPSYDAMNSTVGKLHNAWMMLSHPIVLTDGRLAPAIRALTERFDLGPMRVAVVDELRRCEREPARHPSRPEDLALLLLTSGSTGLPKAVMQNHRSLVSRSAGTSALNGFTPKDVSLNWMPLDHVGGIVMFHIRDVYLGCRQIHAPTELILQDPLKWLDFIERFRATVTWAPNFAFGLVNAKEEAIRERRWDLSSMRFILNGGEAIVARTARRFLRLLDPHGLPATCMHPAWGMSETSSGVTYSDRFSIESTRDDDPFVEVGAPIPGFSMRIVDARDGVVEEEVIGRLEVRGESVTSGYYHNPELTNEAFAGDGWFKTGDLGFLRDGRLTITGRDKDVIIINGVNYYSHEIEAVVEELSGVVVSFTAACAVRSAGTDTDGLAVFFHPSSGDDANLPEVLKSIRENIVKKVGINPDYLIPVAEEVIPKTAIGKIQRSKLSERFNAGAFDAMLKKVDLLVGNANTLPAWFYQNAWRRKRVATPLAQPGRSPVLVFMDRSGLGASVCIELDRLGWQSVRVEAGSDFANPAGDRYRIDPRNLEHYLRLFAAMAADGIRVGQILHLWTYDPPATEIATAADLERSQDRGVYSLLFVVQALARLRGNTDPIELQVVSSRSQQVLDDDRVEYVKGPVLGLVRTASQEMPWLSCRHLDLPFGGATANVACVLEEMCTHVRDREVAYRHGERWVSRLQRVDFPQREKHELPFRRGGMYLISGGLGGIGAEIAKYLLQEYEAKLLLVGRTALARAGTDKFHADENAISERIRTYRALEQLKGEIQYEAVDVCELQGLQQALERAKGRWRCGLDGVIHLAGIYRERLLTEETRENFSQVLGPKVTGTWALSRLLEDEPGKVFISFSSLSGRFGGALNGAYSAANSFLEGFTYFQRHERGMKSYCIEWSTWDELGVSRGYALKQVARSRGYHAISITQGIYSLLAALHIDQPHLLAGLDGDNRLVRQQTETEPYRGQKLYAYFTARADSAPGDRLRSVRIRDRFGTPVECKFRQVSQLPETELGEIDRERLVGLSRRPRTSSREYVGPRTDLERQIAGFWREVLGISQAGIDEDFFELGGNSLMASQVASRINEAFGIQLSLRTLLEESTVAQVALAVQRHLEVGAPVKSVSVIERMETLDPEAILARLDQLSDDEVRSLLGRTVAQEEKR